MSKKAKEPEKKMILPPNYVPGSDSMYLHIVAPTLQAAIAGMRKYMNALDWSKEYVAYVIGVESTKKVNGKLLKHSINPVQTNVGWVLEIPNAIAENICMHMADWLDKNPDRKASVDLLTKEQMQALMLSETDEVII